MKLMTKDLAQQIPALYTQEHVKDPMVYTKFFTPWNSIWCITEFDGKDTFFGYKIGYRNEFSQFSLSELEFMRTKGRIRIDREVNFKPKPLSQILYQEFFDKLYVILKNILDKVLDKLP